MESGFRGGKLKTENIVFSQLSSCSIPELCVGGCVRWELQQAVHTWAVCWWLCEMRATASCSYLSCVLVAVWDESYSKLFIPELCVGGCVRWELQQAVHTWAVCWWLSDMRATASCSYLSRVLVAVWDESYSKLFIPELCVGGCVRWELQLSIPELCVGGCVIWELQQAVHTWAVCWWLSEMRATASCSYLSCVLVAVWDESYSKLSIPELCVGGCVRWELQQAVHTWAVCWWLCEMRATASCSYLSCVLVAVWDESYSKLFIPELCVGGCVRWELQQAVHTWAVCWWLCEMRATAVHTWAVCWWLCEMRATASCSYLSCVLVAVWDESYSCSYLSCVLVAVWDESYSKLFIPELCVGGCVRWELQQAVHTWAVCWWLCEMRATASCPYLSCVLVAVWDESYSKLFIPELCVGGCVRWELQQAVHTGAVCWWLCEMRATASCSYLSCVLVAVWDESYSKLSIPELCVGGCVRWELQQAVHTWAVCWWLCEMRATASCSYLSCVLVAVWDESYSKLFIPELCVGGWVRWELQQAVHTWAVCWWLCEMRATASCSYLSCVLVAVWDESYSCSYLSCVLVAVWDESYSKLFIPELCVGGCVRWELQQAVHTWAVCWWLCEMRATASCSYLSCVLVAEWDESYSKLFIPELCVGGCVRWELQQAVHTWAVCW